MAADHLGGSRDIGTLVHGERQVLEMIATGAPLASVLDELCRVIDERSHLMSAVFLLDDSGKHLTYIAGPHVPDLWRQVVSAAPLPVTGAGACGTAVTRHEQVVVPDLAVDPTYQQSFREVARTVGIHAAWSTPFYAKDHRVLGTFAVYSPAIGPPNALDLELVARATHLASVAVEHHQTEASLRESERRFSTVFYANAAAMSIARTADGRFLYVNDRFVTLYGHSREDVIGQTALSLGLYEDPSQRYDLLAQVLGRGRAQDFEARARTKTADVLDILIWAERIQLLGEDCILAITLEHTDRKRAEEALRRSEGLLRQVLDALPVGVAVVDRSGDVIRTNPASTRIWGRSIESGRERYAKSKGWWHDSGERVAPDEWASVRAVANGEAVNEVVDIESFDGVRKVIQNSAVPIRDAQEQITGAVIVNVDISARDTAERELSDSYKRMRMLTGRLMRAQDDERRRIAQLLHETTAQNLAALKMLLARLNRSSLELGGSDRDALTDSISLAEQSMTEVRTLSYLLYPPFLDEAGLLTALRWYAAGFAERGGIRVDLDLPDTLERLPLDTETALFRVVQEALINIHRHAESDTARIRLRRDADTLTLEIEDQGHGIPSSSLNLIARGGGALGVGIAGMSERLQQLGGRLEIASGDRGTAVRAVLPLVKGTPN